MENCVFCKLALDKNKHIASNAHAFAVYDIAPQSKGHALVITNRHATNYFELNNEEVDAVHALLKQVREKLKKEFSPAGFVVRSNDGKAAGQIVFHAHVHLIPAYESK
ncbi:MAG TPA: HIT family protein [Candidatus Norongarragalinales archaeon]|jgi:diadenosine tetraphosphate (Ap4A) HIT family hydrolase|nr:HIT family protein [Candidatus Norongarragalinales archaeon]